MQTKYGANFTAFHAHLNAHLMHFLEICLEEREEEYAFVSYRIKNPLSENCRRFESAAAAMFKYLHWFLSSSWENWFLMLEIYDSQKHNASTMTVIAWHKNVCIVTEKLMPSCNQWLHAIKFFWHNSKLPTIILLVQCFAL